MGRRFFRIVGERLRAGSIAHIWQVDYRKALRDHEALGRGLHRYYHYVGSDGRILHKPNRRSNFGEERRHEAERRQAEMEQRRQWEEYERKRQEQQQREAYENCVRSEHLQAEIEYAEYTGLSWAGSTSVCDKFNLLPTDF